MTVPDDEWQRMETAAADIVDRYFDRVWSELHSEFEVHAARRRFKTGRRVLEGLVLVGWELGPDGYGTVFEPVRMRPWFKKEWRQVQPISAAAGVIERRLGEWVDYNRRTDE